MLTNIYDVLRSPKTALERINEQADIYKALNLQGIVLFINALTNKYDAASEDPLWLTLLTAVIAVPVVLAITYLVTGFTHGIARLTAPSFWHRNGSRYRRPHRYCLEHHTGRFCRCQNRKTLYRQIVRRTVRTDYHRLRPRYDIRLCGDRYAAVI